MIPNVFDFDAPTWSMDYYNQDLRQRIGLNASNFMVLQATRVIPRKAIELAIDFVDTLNTSERRSKLMRLGLYNGNPFTEGSRIVLVLTGYTKDDVSGNYLSMLKRKARDKNVELVHIEDMIAYSRSIHQDKKIYSFWDAYTAADLITYPSMWEGWGNQLLEAVQARLPVVLFEYPVFVKDIKSKGFRFITLGSDINRYDKAGLVRVSQEVLDQAANEAITVLTDGGLRNKMVTHNHQIGQMHYSLHALESLLTDLLKGL